MKYPYWGSGNLVRRGVVYADWGSDKIYEHGISFGLKPIKPTPQYEIIKEERF